MDLTEKLPNKIRLKAIQIMLSAKLFEDRLVVIESEKVDFFKTRYLESLLQPFQSEKMTFLVPFDCDRNFQSASRSLSNITLRNPQQLHVPDLVKSDLIFLTKEGLQQYEEILQSRHMNYYRNRKVPRTEELPSEKYLGSFTAGKNLNPIYESIVRPTFEHSEELKSKQLELLHPAVNHVARELARRELKQAGHAQ
jgi:hypothetical protein